MTGSGFDAVPGAGGAASAAGALEEFTGTVAGGANDVETVAGGVVGTETGVATTRFCDDAGGSHGMDTGVATTPLIGAGGSVNGTTGAGVTCTGGKV